ncbi:N-acetyltransferase family protein [Dysgonomonas sp. OttesenSCG-928-M03]|nr:N-acetyltransferase family protein [Dysgonomonas sp. OttesenSCG-928-M03]
MTADIIIRPTTKDDIPQINNILNDIIVNSDYYLSGKPRTPEDTMAWFEEHQRSDYYASFTALCGNDFAGWVSLSPFRKAEGYNTTAELSIYIHPDYYRKGIGSALMWKIEDFAKEKGVLHSIISVISANNTPSIALHKKHNYITQGLLKEIAFKNNRFHDVILMTKII